MSKKHLVRDAFRKAVFDRDRHQCVMCGTKTTKLDAHHIVDRHEMPNGGYVLENGISLCDQPDGCHEKAEAFHKGVPVPQGYRPEDLYMRIGSSYDLAFAASYALGAQK